MRVMKPLKIAAKDRKSTKIDEFLSPVKVNGSFKS